MGTRPLLNSRLHSSHRLVHSYPSFKGDVMDPDALWQMILENLRILHKDPQNRDERENVISNLRDLIDWLRSGGFPPTIE